MTSQPPNTLGSSYGPLDPANRPGTRRAEDSLSSCSSKRPRVSKTSLVALWCQPPHPLSVNGLLRKHCRNRLYVHPLQWTAQHLELLGYRFIRKSNSTLGGHSQHQHQHQHGHQYQNSLQLPSEATICATINHLRRPSIRDFKTTIMSEFPTACNLTQVDTSHLPFDFKQQTIATVPTSGIFLHRSTVPSLAYLDLECVGSERDKSIGLSMSKKLNGPVWRIRQKQQRQLQPSNEAEDPYIAAVLITLAQGLQYKHQKQSVNGLNADSVPTVLPQQTATNFEVRLVALARDARSLYFYTASIPSIALDTLNKPGYYYNINVICIFYYMVQLKKSKKAIQKIKNIINNL
ncbi:hypothetical protein F4802DRAFT_610746 [Xylaria palmicola]|nr:hypothetical protein F4802DRAFT_610746 [Xylaria palmicola]